MFEGVNLFVIIGAAIAFGGFSFGIFTAVAKSFLATGKLIGRVTAIVEKLTADINNLWKHQTIQDDRRDEDREDVIKAVAIGKETRDKVDKMYNIIVEKGMK